MVGSSDHIDLLRFCGFALPDIICFVLPLIIKKLIGPHSQNQSIAPIVILDFAGIDTKALPRVQSYFPSRDIFSRSY
jgi:hypothetical protein